MKPIAVLIFMVFAANSAHGDTLVRVAGGGAENENVPATQAKLIAPFGVDFDKAGNMYIVELQGERVLKVDGKGILTILGGTGKRGDAGDGGPARQALFNGMHSLAVVQDGLLTRVYLADTWNNRIRLLDPRAGTVKAFAGLPGKKAYAGDGGPALQARFGGIYCVALDFSGTKLALTDLDNRRIRIVDLKSGTVELAAGNGQKGIPKDGADANDAPLVDPRAACFDRQGNLYVLERGGHALRIVDPAGKIRTVVGASGKAGNTGDGGDARLATMNGPKHLCVDHDDTVIIADTANHVIRRYFPKDNKIIRLAGTGKKGASGDGGAPLKVSFNEPHGVTVHADGTLYIGDSLNHRVFRWQK
jgi:DNA-binding beta-propeller fold protein YncE